MKTENNRNTHKRAVMYAACNLIENGIVTRELEIHKDGIDLILDNGKTILIRGISNDQRVPVTHDPKCEFEADYVMIVTNLRYKCIRKVYIMKSGDIAAVASNHQIRKTGKDNWFMTPANYRKYSDNHDILKG